MKRLMIIALSIATLGLTSCNSKQSYEIAGTIAPELKVTDGIKVELTYTDKNGEEVKTTTKVQKGKFSFSGDIDEPTLAVLNFSKIADPAVIALENGKIKVQITAVEEEEEKLFDEEDDEEDETEVEEKTYEPFVVISGTPQNDKIGAYEKEIDDFWSIYMDTDEDKRDGLESKYYGIINTYLQDINSLSGQYVFIQNFKNLEFAQLEELFNKMDEKVKTGNPIGLIYKQYLIVAKTGKGAKAIDFSAPTPQGDRLALSDLIGKKPYLLIDFWASWCGPCRRAMPQLKQVYEQYGNRLEILGVSLDSDEQQWKEAINVMQLKWKHISDLKGWKAEAAELYGVNAIPATVLIDSEGNIVGRNLSIEELISIIK